MNKILIVGNWKLNGNKKIFKFFFDKLLKNIKVLKKCKLAIAPPLVYIEYLKKIIDKENICLAAQNVDYNKTGAFTGEVSADMLKDIGVDYVIIGHSERRIFHNETYDIIAKKFFSVKSSGLIPIFCIGESINDYENNKTEEVCIKQLNSIIKLYGVKSIKNTIIAYEPVWAIGTGKNAHVTQIQKIGSLIRNYIFDIDVNIADQLIFQYGGSVNDKNAKEILLQPDIDGLLIGNASLSIDIFSSILKIANNITK